MRHGDVLIGLAGVEIEAVHDFMDASSGLRVGESTELKVMLDGRPLTLSMAAGRAFKSHAQHDQTERL